MQNRLMHVFGKHCFILTECKVMAAKTKIFWLSFNSMTLVPFTILNNTHGIVTFFTSPIIEPKLWALINSSLVSWNLCIASRLMFSKGLLMVKRPKSNVYVRKVANSSV